MRCEAWIALLAVSAAFMGCKDAGPPKAKVGGAVTFDGKPLTAGTIQFFHAEQKAPSAAAEIKDGAYAADVYLGPMRVEITSMKVVGKRKAYDSPDSPWIEETIQILPSRYNAQTTLSHEMRSGENVANFELKSVP